jgi:hypothetical protein
MELDDQDGVDFVQFCEKYETMFRQSYGDVRSGPKCYPEDEVARMGRRCKLTDQPFIRELICCEWRFDHTINQFVVYL